MNSRPACGGYPGEESRHRQENNTIWSQAMKSKKQRVNERRK